MHPFQIRRSADHEGTEVVASFTTLEEAELALQPMGDGHWLTLSGDANIKLTAVQSVRLRPGMYIGDTSASGCRHLLMEVISNSVDQCLQGLATQVMIRAQGQRFTVQDDGAGIDRDKAKTHLTSLHFTPTADRHAPHVHLAPRGVGICVVNALAAKMTVTSFDSMGTWRQAFQRGVLVSEESVLDRTGTEVEVVLDPRIFANTDLPSAEIRRVVFEAAHLFPGISFGLNEEKFFSEQGLIDLAEFEGASTGLWPSASPSPRSARFGHVHDGAELTLTCALVGVSTSSRSRVSSWVNGVLTPGHGTHVDGLEDALQAVGWKPQVCLIHVVMKEPQYAGPTTDSLATPKVRRLVKEALLPPLRRFVSCEF